MQKEDEVKTIETLDMLINRYKTEGLKGVLADCNGFGNPELNLLYKEIYGCCINGQFILALTGSGMFLEQLTTEIWISDRVHKAQLRGQFNNWDKMMVFLESQYQIVEDQKINYQKDVRPTLETILDAKDIEAMELLRELVRNTFVHFKRIKLLDTLRKNKVLPDEIPVGKATIAGKVVTKAEQIKLSLTHPLINKFAFVTVAKQLAPAMVIYIFELFKKYHKQMAPLRDDQIGFPGHECEYDL